MEELRLYSWRQHAADDVEQARGGRRGICRRATLLMSMPVQFRLINTDRS